MVLWRPVRNAIFSLVPTPSAELDQHRILPAREQIAAAKAADIGEHGSRECAARMFADEAQRRGPLRRY